MNGTLQLKQLTVSFNLPSAITFQHIDAKGFCAFFLISADGGLVLACQCTNSVPRLEPDQAVETAQLIDRNHAEGQDFLIFG